MDKSKIALDLARIRAYVSIAEVSIKDGTATPVSLQQRFDQIRDAAQRCVDETMPVGDR